MTDNEHHIQADDDRREFSEEADSLWRLTLAPSTWAAHLLVCYATVSLACSQQLFPIGPARYALIGLSVFALAFIGWLAWKAFGRWDMQGSPPSQNSAELPEDRHHFLGHAAFLIAIISAIGTVFTTLPLLLLEGCR